MSDCINFSGCISTRGYGLKNFEGRVRLAHRVAYCVHNGKSFEDIAGMVVRHKCDNRACVNPEHLELGTQKDNMRDAIVRGRHAFGERHGMRRINDEIVRQIRARCVPGSRESGQSALAREFGISQMQVWSIVNRRTWKHV